MLSENIMGNTNITPSEEDKTIVRICVEYLNRIGVSAENNFGPTNSDEGMLRIIRNEIITSKL